MEIHPDRYHDDFAEPRGWRDLHAALDAAAAPPADSAAEPMPAVRIENSARLVTICVELPGIEDGDILVRLIGQELVISGERRCATPSEAHEFVTFYHTIPLPMGVRAQHDRISAFYHDGTLEIRVPKLRKA